MTYWLWSVPPDLYSTFVRTGTFAIRRVGRGALQDVRPGDRIVAYLPGLQVLAGLFEATSAAFEDATPLAPEAPYPHRLRVRPLVALTEDAWVPYAAFAHKLAVLDEYADVPDRDLRFRAVVQRVLHPLPTVDGKVLEFLVYARQADLDRVLEAYDRYVRARDEAPAPVVTEPPPVYDAAPFAAAPAGEALLEALRAAGFVYQPWQVAAFVTALRTKPFLILAGPTGVGKSRLPALVAAHTDAAHQLLPVHPDWTDSAEVLGYMDLQGRFRPGPLLRAARTARQQPTRYHLVTLDEMNLARPEHYLADVLSRLEERTGTTPSGPLLDTPDPAWTDVGLPPNLAFVGTVNVDETTHGFSPKVLDRAFVLELGEVDLRLHPTPSATPPPASWPLAAWLAANAPTSLAPTDPGEAARTERVLELLDSLQAVLEPAGLPLGYRARNELVGFVHHAAAWIDGFRTLEGAPVDPLDLALTMKVLPRLAGGRPRVRHAVAALLTWAVVEDGVADADEADLLLDAYLEAGRPVAYPDARFPRTAARLARMVEDAQAEGYVSFWG